MWIPHCMFLWADICLYIFRWNVFVCSSFFIELNKETKLKRSCPAACMLWLKHEKKHKTLCFFLFVTYYKLLISQFCWTSCWKFSQFNESWIKFVPRSSEMWLLSQLQEGSGNDDCKYLWLNMSPICNHSLTVPQRHKFVMYSTY